jgi:hypothetical protein
VNSWSDIGSVSWAVEASFAASTLIDIVISVAMCFYLRKSKGAESRLNSRLSTLMVCVPDHLLGRAKLTRTAAIYALGRGLHEVNTPVSGLEGLGSDPRLL